MSIDSPSDKNDLSVSMDLPDPGQSPEETCIAIELAEIVRKQIYSLPESGRSVFVKLYLEHLSIDQTARVLGISVAATKSRALRARRDLRGAFLGRFAPGDIRKSIQIVATQHNESKAW